MSNNRFVSSLKSLAGTLLGAGLIAAAPMTVSSCVHNDPNAERSEFIDVYANQRAIDFIPPDLIYLKYGGIFVYYYNNIKTF